MINTMDILNKNLFNKNTFSRFLTIINLKIILRELIFIIQKY